MSDKSVQEKSLQHIIRAQVRETLAEDVGSGDISAELVHPHRRQATILSRENAVICGFAWAEEVFRQVDPSLSCERLVREGEKITAGTAILNLQGNAKTLLTAERCALNFLQVLSGTATLCRQYADLVRHTCAQLLDTRKTLPGLRAAQKYAVTLGGCHNHRMGLYDAFLIKENHIKSCGGIAEVISRAKKMQLNKPIIIEVENLEEFHVAQNYDVQRIMLDNFIIEDIKMAVRQKKRKTKIEVSGGANLQNIVKLAETGVDYISIGALTKNCLSIDLSMQFT